MKKILITLLICITFQIANSQSGWVWQNPLPQGNNLNSIKFINSNTGFVVGDLGTIMKTTNGGNNWNIVNFDNTRKLNSIFVFDSVNLIVCGNSGILMKSSNSGLNWTSIQSGTTKRLNKIFFLDKFKGFMVGDSGAFFKTTNQGVNWSAIQSGTNSELFTIYFKNVNTGYLSGSSSIYRITTDGGDLWNNVSLPINVFFEDITFISDSVGFGAGSYQYIGSSGVVYKTTNGGYNWYLSSGGPMSECYSIAFNNAYTGLVAQQSGISLTTNSGLNWNYCYMEPNRYTSLTITGGHCFVAGWGGSIIKSTNLGLNWSNQTNLQFGQMNSDIFFINSNSGYICGNQPGDSMIIKTTNSGINWMQIHGPTFFSNQSMFFIDFNTGYLVNGSNRIYKTINGGINWSIYQTSSASGFHKVVFLNATTGILGGGTFYKTTDSGNNWFMTSTLGGTIYDISFPDSNIGYAVQTGYGIIKTSNAGSSWYVLPNIPEAYYIPSVSFMNANTGFVTADVSSSSGGNVIFKTTNAGLNWQNKFSNYPFGLNCVRIKPSGVGYAVGDNGITLKTVNGGENWYYQNSITDNSLYSIFEINDSLVFLAGEHKTILKTTNGGGQIIGINQITENIPDAFSLHQNYPNPFNPTTKIKFDIPAVGTVPRTVRLTIYDILGREVTTLVNDALKPGTYEAEWPAPTGDASKFASGLYFYKLQAGDYIETKKMVLLK